MPKEEKAKLLFSLNPPYLISRIEDLTKKLWVLKPLSHLGPSFLPGNVPFYHAPLHFLLCIGAFNRL